MSDVCNDCACRPAPDGVTGAVFRAFYRVVDRVQQWQAMAKERRQLLALDQRMLKDIGVSQADAMREANRPFWDDAPRRPGAGR